MTGLITVSPPDLTITAVSATPSSITRPGMLSITFTVKNLGLSAALPVNIGFYLSTTNVITTSNILIGTFVVNKGLAAGASYTATVSDMVRTTVPAGTYYVGAYADYSNLLVETSKANNGLASSTTTVVH